jgi:hypothetical protein
MKLNFRKISALASSALMLGMTAGIAAAANYPAPFVVGGAADVAIVYGSGAVLSDSTAAGSIATSLSSFVTGTESTATGGDSFKIEKSSDKLNLGNSAYTVYVSSLDDDELPSLLAEGTYTDDDNTDYDFTQKVDLGYHLNVTHFSDTDYDDVINSADPVPTIGVQLAGSTHVLNYTLDFTTAPDYNAATLETTTMRLMGRDYYVLDVINGTTNKTTFLDSANSAMITEGQTSTVAGKSITISYISSTEVRLDVDGTATNSLAEGATYKLPDGTYVGIKDIMYDSKEAGISQVEISIGTGKLEVDHGAAIELNDESIEEIVGFLVQDSSEQLDKIVLMWTTDDEEFITPANELVMPGFGALKLSMGPFTFPESEETEVEGGSTQIDIKTTLKDGSITIPILGANSTGQFTVIGKDATNKLLTTNATSGIIFNETDGDKYMVLSWNSTAEAESYYIRADVVTVDTVDKVRFTNEITGAEKYAADDDTVSFGNVDLTVNSLTRVGGINETFYFSLNSGSSLNTLYTAESMKVYLPWNLTVADYKLVATLTVPGVILWGNGTNTTYDGHAMDNFDIFVESEDKYDNIGGGDAFNLTVEESGTTNKVHVSSVTTDGSGYEIGTTDDYEYYIRDDLATKIVHYTGGDYDSAKITYNGAESFANLYLSAPETVVGGTGSLGDVLVTDSEVSTVSSKNLIVVGGSCINSAAATLVGGAYCGSAWTGATGVGTGQFLIKSYADAANGALTSKMALLVAGYEAADTTNAATYLRTKTVDTSVGGKGTTSTAALTAFA